MFLLAAALLASSASPSTKSRLSVLTLFLTSLFAAVCSFWAAAFAALVRLLLTAPFLSFLIFLIVSAELQSFCCGFLLPSTSSHVVFTAPLMSFQCLSMFTPSSSSYNSWRTLNLLLNVTLYSCSVFFILQIIHNLYLPFLLSWSTSFVLTLSFNLAVTRWWSEATSAPLFTRTSCSDLRNILLMPIWSIWFSVTWSGDTQVALCILLWGNTLPPITMLLAAHALTNRSPCRSSHRAHAPPSYSHILGCLI